MYIHMKSAYVVSIQTHEVTQQSRQQFYYIFSRFLVSRLSDLFLLSELLFAMKILQAEWERCATALLKHIGHLWAVSLMLTLIMTS